MALYFIESSITRPKSFMAVLLKQLKQHTDTLYSVVTTLALKSNLMDGEQMLKFKYLRNTISPDGERFGK